MKINRAMGVHHKQVREQRSRKKIGNSTHRIFRPKQGVGRAAAGADVLLREGRLRPLPADSGR
jgi:hypothetical protein